MGLAKLKSNPSRSSLSISHSRQCECPEKKLNCLTAKEWIKNQIGVWQFFYEGRDIRDKKKHPATYPIALAKRCIELFTHAGELVVDPFVGSGTTLVAAQDCNRNAVGFDLNENYIQLSKKRLSQNNVFNSNQQIALCDDARYINQYLENETIKLILTSPPYANLLNRKRKNKSRRGQDRQNGQYNQIEQYSQNPNDLGILSLDEFISEFTAIFKDLLPLLKPEGHCIINVADMWWENKRIPIHLEIIKSLTEIGYEFRNTIIWDRTNIVNKVGIFGWPSNYITMGTTFEYILHFIKA